MMLLERVEPIYAPEQPVIVAATGPSLKESAAKVCLGSGLPIIAVSDAYRLLPQAAIIYSNDAAWWRCHGLVVRSTRLGARYSSHDKTPANSKTDAAARYGLKLVQGEHAPGFSFDPTKIHYGKNSGFQAVNLAILLGSRNIVLIGFDMEYGYGKHFFGDHDDFPGLRQKTDHSAFVRYFRQAAGMAPPELKFYNGTPRRPLTSGHGSPTWSARYSRPCRDSEHEARFGPPKD